MAVAQLSFWDNEALERGYRSLADLELRDAIHYFNEALAGGIGDKETTQKAMDACYYWQPKIKPGEVNAMAVAKLLADYKEYTFTALMTGFKKSLLRYIVDCMVQQASPASNKGGQNANWDEMETAFDLLLELKEYQKAENFISLLTSYNTGTKHLLYFLAQAQWLNGNKASSNENYMLALLQHPDKSFIDRVENKKIKSLINSYGAAITPAYCLLLGVVPVAPGVNNIEFRDDEHAKAIRSLHLLREVNKASFNNDRALMINSRKQLKAENPALYEVYFNVLKQRQ